MSRPTPQERAECDLCGLEHRVVDLIHLETPVVSQEICRECYVYLDDSPGVPEDYGYE